MDSSAVRRTFTQDLRVEDLKSAEAKAHAERIARCKAVVSEIAGVVNQGWELRQVEVREIEDWEGKRIIHVRSDTGEEISQRPMTEEERQPRLLA